MGTLYRGDAVPDAIYRGATLLDAVYRGAEKVWPPPALQTWRFYAQIGGTPPDGYISAISSGRVNWPAGGKDADGQRVPSHMLTLGPAPDSTYAKVAIDGVVTSEIPSAYTTTHFTAYAVRQALVDAGAGAEVFIQFGPQPGWVGPFESSPPYPYFRKLRSLGATFIQHGGLDVESGLALPSGSDPGVSVDGIDAWTGSFSMDIGDQMAAGGDWSMCAIYRRADGGTNNAAIFANGTGTAYGATQIRSEQDATATWERTYHGNTFINPRTDQFIPPQNLQDWTFAGFNVIGVDPITPNYNTVGTVYILNDSGVLQAASKNRNNDPGTLNLVVVGLQGDAIQYAGIALFPNVLLTGTDFEDLLALLPSVGPGNS